MRRSIAIAFSLVCVMLLFVGSASAGLNTWTGTGPTGGAIRAVLVDPNAPSTIYIGTVGSGVFKSMDGGVTWFPSEPAGPLGTLTVRSLVFGASGTIYAGTDTSVDSASGVFQSINGGATWTPIGTAALGLANRKVQALAWDGASLYAGTREETVGSPATLFTGGVFKWNGATWTQMNAGLPNQASRRVQALAIDSRTNPPVVYAGTQGEGVFKSVDGGGNWTRIDNPANQGFRSDCLDQPEILALAVDTTVPLQGATGARLYAGATGNIGTTGCGPTPAQGGHQGQGAGFFRYVPDAPPSQFGSWDRRMGGAFELLLPTTVSSHVWAIVMRTTPSPTRLFIGTDHGVFTSNDGAGSWDGVPRIDLPDDLISLPIRALGIDPTSSDPDGTVTLYAGTNGRGMFKRFPNVPVGEDPWTLINNGLTALRAQALAVGSRGGSKALFAGLSGGGIITSINNGLTWQDTPEKDATVRAIATDPATPSTVYAATGKGIIRSLNGGESWALASAGLPTTASQDPNDPTPPRTVRAITVDPANPTTLYAAVGGVYRSVDRGVTWTSVNGNLPSTVTAGDGTVSAIVIDSSSPGVNPTWGNLYAAADGDDVYASSDGGVTWTPIPGLPGADDSVLTLALDPLPPAMLYAGTETGKVFRWQIGGLDGWSSFKRLTLPGPAITSLVVQLGAPSRIFAGTAGAGVWVIASDRDEIWEPMNSGLSSPAALNVSALAYDPQGTGTLYAATLGRGIFDFEFVSINPLFVNITSPPPPPPFSTGTSPIVVSGIVTGGAPDSFSVFWSTNRGQAGFATGTSNWSASVPLELGQNIITVTAVDASFNQGSASITVTLETTPTPPPLAFADVPANHVFFGFIQAIAKAGITGGCATNPAQYCPDGAVRRDQMAVFLLRGIHGGGYQPPAAAGTMFGDVPASQPFATWIEQLARESITGGCSQGAPMYCPDGQVTRGQMAVFLLRSKHGAGYQPPPATGTMFTDVPATHLFATWIEQLAREGITAGCGATTYCPDTTVTRGQMAVFLTRSFNLPL